ncbi:unnamed protein product [Pleuronectes platessa]|uniref:Secreted protein n=1 Tax=Pleuronectes platessa TaxID=8262 RepID=A0A9N7Y4U9_PLEPL|nr:unnamed protein product [Pleuronectes platessa]
MCRLIPERLVLSSLFILSSAIVTRCQRRCFVFLHGDLIWTLSSEPVPFWELLLQPLLAILVTQDRVDRQEVMQHRIDISDPIVENRKNKCKKKKM